MADNDTPSITPPPGKPAGLGTLNLAAHQAIDESTSQREVFPEPEPPTMIVMLDIETLALGTRPVITQVALLGYDLEEDELMDPRHVQYYPVEPQQQLIPPRRIQASTIDWWMKQSDDVRERFTMSTSTDFQDLPALARNLITVFNQLTRNGTTNYELVAKGPQFDVAAIETLLEELGLEVPWAYDRVVDLRTMLRRAGINAKNVPQPAGTIPHVAFWDARWQIAQYLECLKVFGRR